MRWLFGVLLSVGMAGTVGAESWTIQGLMGRAGEQIVWTASGPGPQLGWMTPFEWGTREPVALQPEFFLAQTIRLNHQVTPPDGGEIFRREFVLTPYDPVTHPAAQELLFAIQHFVLPDSPPAMAMDDQERRLATLMSFSTALYQHLHSAEREELRSVIPEPSTGSFALVVLLIAGWREYRKILHHSDTRQ